MDGEKPVQWYWMRRKAFRLQGVLRVYDILEIAFVTSNRYMWEGGGKRERKDLKHWQQVRMPSWVLERRLKD